MGRRPGGGGALQWRALSTVARGGGGAVGRPPACVPTLPSGGSVSQVARMSASIWARDSRSCREEGGPLRAVTHGDTRAFVRGVEGRGAAGDKSCASRAAHQRWLARRPACPAQPRLAPPAPSFALPTCSRVTNATTIILHTGQSKGVAPCRAAVGKAPEATRERRRERRRRERRRRPKGSGGVANEAGGGLFTQQQHARREAQPARHGRRGRRGRAHLPNAAALAAPRAHAHQVTNVAGRQHGGDLLRSRRHERGNLLRISWGRGARGHGSSAARCSAHAGTCVHSPSPAPHRPCNAPACPPAAARPPARTSGASRRAGRRTSWL